jgi:hypothetical protein
MRPDSSPVAAPPQDLHDAAARLRGAAQAVGREGALVRAEAAGALGGDSWLGPAAQAAHRAHARRATAAERVAATLQRAATALDRLGAAIAEARRGRARVLEQATGLGWRLQAGRLVPATLGDPPVFGTDLPGRWAGIGAAQHEADAAAAAALRAVAADLHRMRLPPGTAALAPAVDPAQALTLARLGLLTVGVMSPGEAITELRRLLRLGDPVPIQAFLLCLPASARQALVAGFPDVVGAADGVPPAMRYAANRLLLIGALAAARHGGDAAATRRIAGWLRPGRQFLLVDLAGGRVVEVFGDLGTAAHVAVLVPGIRNDPATFDSLAADARNLKRQADRLGAGDVATIAWLGYRTPGLLDAPFDDRAVAASHRLAGLVGGLLLRAGVTTTVVAHSYGSLLVGRELRAGLRVDAVVALGSPGMTAKTAGGLHATPGTRLYAGRAPGDYVSLSENFGRDPSDPRFGAVRIATRTPGGPGPVGHTGYFTGQSECTRNLARIITGQYTAVTVLPPSPAERVVEALDPVPSVADTTSSALLAGADGLARLLPGPVQPLAESGVEAARRLEHLNRRLADPDLLVDTLDTR